MDPLDLLGNDPLVVENSLKDTMTRLIRLQELNCQLTWQAIDKRTFRYNGIILEYLGMNIVQIDTIRRDCVECIECVVVTERSIKMVRRWKIKFNDSSSVSSFESDSTYDDDHDQDWKYFEFEKDDQGLVTALVLKASKVRERNSIPDWNHVQGLDNSRFEILSPVKLGLKQPQMYESVLGMLSSLLSLFEMEE